MTNVDLPIPTYSTAVRRPNSLPVMSAIFMAAFPQPHEVVVPAITPGLASIASWPQAHLNS
ncbi:hypothetical protein ACPV5A_25530, partial [Vibrio chagasii]|uniref:hypothetical protein n=1 Tax=Vibrio chagasii TaxID=170679 RepID=UPI00406816E1